MKLFMKIISVLICVLMQTACTTMNSSFDCPNKAGVNCKSLDQVNNMVDSGQILGRTQMSNISMEPPKIAEIAKVADGAEFESYPTLSSFSSGKPLRYGETVQRIRIAPYEDTEGNYHEDCRMYSIMQGGKWIGQPVKAIKIS